MTDQPFEIIAPNARNRWLITCDHATNHVPDHVNDGSLGLSSREMGRHIAFDIGAAGVTRALAQALDARAILSKFSRLVIDPNRGEDDPTLVMRLYDGTIVPGNRNANAAEIEHRLNACYRPYHAAYADLAAKIDQTIIIAVHSFTPRLNSRAPRPWHIGLLFAGDTRLSNPLLTRLRRDPDLCVGENEPYAGHLPGDAVDRHALKTGRPNVLLEIRQDLIETQKGQQDWGFRLAPILQDILKSGVV